MSTERQAATDLDRLIPRDDDPPAETGRVLLYSRVVDETLRALKEGRQQKTDMSKMRANKDEVDNAGQDYAANERDKFEPGGPDVAVRQEPIKVGPKVGRNDPCPCGSGKKYKQCHGKDA